METIWQDVRYALRMLRKNHGFATVAVLTLALGIGANTAMFSVVNAVLLRPLPYPESERLVRVEEHHGGPRPSNFTYASFLDLKNSSQTLKDVGAYRWWTFNLTGDGEPESVKGAEVSAEYFSALRMRAFLGRVFTSEEDKPGSAGVVVLGYGFWQRRYGSDAHVIGRIVRVNDEAVTIIGVMPAGFREPYEAEIWAPLVATRSLARNRRSHLLTVVARLSPGSELAQANAEMEILARRIDQENPDVDPDLRIGAVSLQERVVAPVQPLLIVLLGAVGCVLLIASANLANLLLARGARRSREFAIRAALGAGRARLARQLVTESLLLALLGAGVGVMVARWCLPTLAHFLLTSVSGLADVSLDGRVLGFAAIITVLTGLFCGIAPAIENARRDVQRSLNESSRGSTGVRQRRLRDVFVISEVAFALVLLIAAGLLLESFGALLRVPLGFEPKGLVTMQLFLSPTRFSEGSPLAARYLDQVVKKLEEVPGVKSAAIVDSLPLNGGASTDFEILGRPAPKPGDEPEADIHMVSAEYFRTMGIRLVAGRWFTERDTAESPRVMVISEKMARQFWPGADPIGQRVTMKDWGPPLTGTIVGVVGDVKLDGLEAVTRPALYWPYTQFNGLFNSIVVRTDAAPRAIVPELKAAIWSINGEQTIASIQTMDDTLADQFVARRFNLGLLGAFAGLALLLSSLGIYGVLAQAVQQRTQEIGIRMALGAERGDVLKLVLKQGLTLSLIGIAIGLAGSLGLMRVMSNLLFGIHATDPAAFVGAAILLMIVALAACWIPARRAMRVDPMVALRHE